MRCENKCFSLEQNIILKWNNTLLLPYTQERESCQFLEISSSSSFLSSNAPRGRDLGGGGVTRRAASRFLRPLPCKRSPTSLKWKPAKRVKECYHFTKKRNWCLKGRFLSARTKWDTTRAYWIGLLTWFCFFVFFNFQHPYWECLIFHQTPPFFPLGFQSLIAKTSAWVFSFQKFHLTPPCFLRPGPNFK